MSDPTPEEATELRKALGIEVHTHPSPALALGPELTRLLDDLPPDPRAFIAAFRRLHSITKAAKELGFTRDRHYYWLNESPFRHVYAAIWKVLEDELTDALEERNTERALDGFREEMYAVDGDGNEKLKMVKVKHDAAYLKMALVARKPEVYGNDRGAGSINIQIIVAPE